MICCRKRRANGISGDTPDLFVALATVNCLDNLGRCRLGGLLHEHPKGTIGRKCVAEVEVTVVCFFIDRCWTFGPWKVEGRYIVTHHASFVVTQFQVLSVGALTTFSRKNGGPPHKECFTACSNLGPTRFVAKNHHSID